KCLRLSTQGPLLNGGSRPEPSPGPAPPWCRTRVPDESLIPPERAVRQSLRLAATVVAITTTVVTIVAAIVPIVRPRLATFVPLSASVPAVVVRNIAASPFPLPAKILSTFVIGIDPVRALTRGSVQ